MQDTEDRAEGLIVPGRGHVAFRIAEHPPDEVRVCVNETGQERDVPEIDHFRSRRHAYGTRGANRGYSVVSNDDDSVLYLRRAGGVDKTRRFQHDDTLAFGRLVPYSNRS